MALKDLQAIDFERLLAVASEIDNLPKGQIPYYQERLQKLERLIPRIQRDMARGGSTSLQAKERELYNLLSGDPEYVKNQAKWAKEGKLLRLFQAHHKAPLAANAQGFLYLPPVKHSKITANIAQQGIYQANHPLNRVSGHVVQHLGDSRALVGKAGSVGFSWHPGGTKAIRLNFDPGATVKSIADEIVSFNEPFIADVERSLKLGANSIQNFTYEAMDKKLRALGSTLTARDSPAPELFRTLNKYRREILDDAANMAGYTSELRSGLGTPKDFKLAFKTLWDNKVGALAGAANPAVVENVVAGKPVEATKAAVGGIAGGAIAQQAARTVTSLAPKAGAVVFKAAAKAGPLFAAQAGYETLNAIVKGGTGKSIPEHGVAAEEEKTRLKEEEGYSDYELRRRARTGYTKPQNTPETP